MIVYFVENNSIQINKPFFAKIVKIKTNLLKLQTHPKIKISNTNAQCAHSKILKMQFNVQYAILYSNKNSKILIFLFLKIFKKKHHLSHAKNASSKIIFQMDIV
jgi:hypothetical protein